MANRIRLNAPKNFPNTMCQIEMGLVSNNSSVPCFFSSEKLRIVTAGIRKSKIQGAIVKKGVISANPEFNTLYSPSNTHKKSPLKSKNKAITKYPMREPKKDLISRSMIDFIYTGLSLFVYRCLLVHKIDHDAVLVIDAQQ